MSRRSTSRLLYGGAAVCLALDVLGVADWGGRAALAIVLGTVCLRLGLGMMAPLRVGEKSHPPVDVISEAGIPVYTCAGCGTQVILLRKGNDRPPRHCGEAMRFDVVPEEPALPGSAQGQA
ncbi:MAG TPA: hypothetical protein VNA12_05180 [Mycobacteriales bacterium]|nr:hypothetical protein [Mycobacteriales bacterium]